MTLYSYTKSKRGLNKKAIRIFSFLSIIAGLSILSFVLYPILSFELFYAPRINGMVKPVPQIPGEIIRETIAGNLPRVLGTDTIDYTRASNWFPKATSYSPPYQGNAASYNLSIPKVNIDNALVLTGTDDLSKSLIHFAGPLPGNNGNAVIFGHSTLLWFYNPKDYKSIFSKLPELTSGDEIIITVDSVTYKFRIIEMRVISPEDFSPLIQDNESSYITLITCVPPGTYFKRLSVKAKLENI